MFVVFCLALLVLVYVSPALAVHPRLILCAPTALAIPFFSVLIVSGFEVTLATAGFFSQSNVLAFSAGCTVVALFRMKKLIANSFSEFDWPKTHKVIFVITALVAFCFSIKLGSSSFGAHDEIYSWNMWAVQFYRGDPIDYYYTGSPYPQLFPMLIAYCYKLLGSVELQLPVRALIGIFPFCLLSAIAVAARDATFDNIGRYIVLTLVFLFGTGIHKTLDDGLADPMMASALVVAVSLFIRYVDSGGRDRAALWLAAICSIVAAYSKQPALIWTLFSFPLLSILLVLRKRFPPLTLVAAAVVSLASLAWVLGASSGFLYNEGVMNRSLERREILQQLIVAADRYFVDKPLLLLIILAGGISTIRSKAHSIVFFLAILPSLLMWFLYGAYDVRLGIHVISLAALLTAATNYNIPLFANAKPWKSMGSHLQAKQVRVLTLVGALVMAYSFVTVQKTIQNVGDGFDLYSGGRNTIYRYFGRDSEFVYKEIYGKPRLVLWIPSNYIYGIFYGHNRVVRPNYDIGEPYTKESVLMELDKLRPDYVFYAGEVPYGPASDLLYDLAKDCPYLFQAVAGFPNKGEYRVYRLTKYSRLLNQCSRDLDKP